MLGTGAGMLSRAPGRCRCFVGPPTDDKLGIKDDQSRPPRLHDRPSCLVITVSETEGVSFLTFSFVNHRLWSNASNVGCHATKTPG